MNGQSGLQKHKDHATGLTDPSKALMTKWSNMLGLRPESPSPEDDSTMSKIGSLLSPAKQRGSVGSVGYPLPSGPASSNSAIVPRDRGSISSSSTAVFSDGRMRNSGSLGQASSPERRTSSTSPRKRYSQHSTTPPLTSFLTMVHSGDDCNDMYSQRLSSVDYTSEHMYHEGRYSEGKAPVESVTESYRNGRCVRMLRHETSMLYLLPYAET